MQGLFKIKKIPLHIQIILALIFGAIFGIIFNVDVHKLDIKYLENSVHKEFVINNFEKITVNYEVNGEQKTKVFMENTQIEIIKFVSKQIKENKLLNLTAMFRPEKSSKTETKTFENIESISKIGTIATYIRPIGTLFIRLLSFLAIPLVIASLIVGAASLEDIKKLGRIGIRTFTIYILTTAIAITIGLTLANLIRPGDIVSQSSKERLLSETQSDNTNMVENLNINVVDFFVEIVPKNPFKAIADGNMLQIVFFAVMFGITLTFVEKKKSLVLINFFDGVSETMIKMVDFIMKIAPYGVFALIGATIAEFGFDIISTLFWYILTVLLGLLIHTTVVYPMLVKFLGKRSPMKYFKNIRTAQAIGFSTSSSAATLPVTIDCVENKIGIPKQISGFVLPLGATINMDGTALYQGVAAVFIAQIYGFDLGITQQLTIVLTAVLASIGTAPVPGVGIIMLVMILNAIHIPAEGIALILGVDRILDMCRTITNVSGDAAVAVAIAGMEEKNAE